MTDSECKHATSETKFITISLDDLFVLCNEYMDLTTFRSLRYLWVEGELSDQRAIDEFENLVQEWAVLTQLNYGVHIQEGAQLVNKKE